MRETTFQYHSDWLFYYEGQNEKIGVTANLQVEVMREKISLFGALTPNLIQLKKKKSLKTQSFLDIMLKFKSPTWFSEVYRTGPQLTYHQSVSFLRIKWKSFLIWITRM